MTDGETGRQTQFHWFHHEPPAGANDLDSLGFAASKLWNVARWTSERIWNETGHIPDDGELKSYLKSHERYSILHSQSSQRVLEELSEAFTGWYKKRQNGDSKANPPGYRKHNDEHPRSTLTFKGAGFKLDANSRRIRLSKGENLKEYWSDFVLCESKRDLMLTSLRLRVSSRSALSGTNSEMSGNSTSSAMSKSILQRTTQRRPLVSTLASATLPLSHLKSKNRNCIR